MCSFFIPFSSSLPSLIMLRGEKGRKKQVFIFTQQFRDFYQMVGAKIISWKISNEKVIEQSKGKITWLLMLLVNVGVWELCMNTKFP